MAAVSSSVTSLMVAWAESESVGSTWTQTCLEKLELAAETIRLIFFVLGDDASLGPLSFDSPSSCPNHFDWRVHGLPLDLLNRISNASAPPGAPGP